MVAYKYNYRYDKDLVAAVRYLMKKGYTTTEIAKRLDISSFTVINIKKMIRSTIAQTTPTPTEKAGGASKPSPQTKKRIITIDDII